MVGIALALAVLLGALILAWLIFIAVGICSTRFFARKSKKAGLAAAVVFLLVPVFVFAVFYLPAYLAFRDGCNRDAEIILYYDKIEFDRSVYLEPTDKSIGEDLLYQDLIDFFEFEVTDDDLLQSRELQPGLYRMDFLEKEDGQCLNDNSYPSNYSTKCLRAQMVDSHVSKYAFTRVPLSREELIPNYSRRKTAIIDRTSKRILASQASYSFDPQFFVVFLLWDSRKTLTVCEEDAWYRRNLSRRYGPSYSYAPTIFFMRMNDELYTEDIIATLRYR